MTKIPFGPLPEVNGHRLLGMNHLEVVSILKELSSEVCMVCARPRPAPPLELAPPAATLVKVRAPTTCKGALTSFKFIFSCKHFFVFKQAVVFCLLGTRLFRSRHGFISQSIVPGLDEITAKYLNSRQNICIFLIGTVVIVI